MSTKTQLGTTQFNDSNGKSWNIVVDGYTLHQVQASCGINLLAVLEDNQALLKQLFEDNKLFGDVLYTLLKEDCDNNGMQMIDLFRACKSAAVLDQALACIIEGVASFCSDPRHSEMIRMCYKKILLTRDKAVELGGQEAIDTLAQFDEEAEAMKMVDDAKLEQKLRRMEAEDGRNRRRQEIKQRLEKFSSTSSTPAESSESTQQEEESSPTP